MVVLPVPRLNMKLKDIVQKDKIIKVPANSTVSSALSKLTSSHDASFVFDHDSFVGLVTPYHCLIKNSLPGNAKIEHCLYHPSHIQINAPLEKVINTFLESKIHYQPIFDSKDQFIGIVSVRHLLEGLRYDSRLRLPLDEVIRNKKNGLITIYEDDLVSTALNLFKQYKISKLVVINRDLKLKGVLSYYDLIHYLVVPRQKEHLGEREGNKSSFYNQRVRNFVKSHVLTLAPNHTLRVALDLVLDEKIGSVVVVDLEKHPLGIVTTRDFLSILLTNKVVAHLELLHKNLSKQSQEVVERFVGHITHWVEKKPDVSKAQLLVKENKQGGLFQIALSIFPKKGKPSIFKREGKNLVELLDKIKKH
ncbi:CBS domain-containing protein [Candidatus Roizmanbacteria bacterium]|nr:CBS domain-containing protein [Candidatus Roizmanbacteria bacterium]